VGKIVRIPFRKEGIIVPKVGIIIVGKPSLFPCGNVPKAPCGPMPVLV
jgi:hypothetical protein